MKLVVTLFFTVFLLFNISSLNAQVEQTIYQSLVVSDSTMQLEFDIADANEVIPWHHESQVMIELKIRLDGGNMTTLGMLIKDGRYNLTLDNLYPVTTMRLINPRRSLIKNGRNEPCVETVSMRIYIPEGFIVKKNIDPKPAELPTVAKSEKRQ
jgi:hypothetical protein